MRKKCCTVRQEMLPASLPVKGVSHWWPSCSSKRCECSHRRCCSDIQQLPSATASLHNLSWILQAPGGLRADTGGMSVFRLLTLTQRPALRHQQMRAALPMPALRA